MHPLVQKVHSSVYIYSSSPDTEIWFDLFIQKFPSFEGVKIVNSTRTRIIVLRSVTVTVS